MVLSRYHTIEVGYFTKFLNKIGTLTIRIDNLKLSAWKLNAGIVDVSIFSLNDDNVNVCAISENIAFTDERSSTIHLSRTKLTACLFISKSDFEQMSCILLFSNVLLLIYINNYTCGDFLLKITKLGKEHMISEVLCFYLFFLSHSASLY